MTVKNKNFGSLAFKKNPIVSSVQESVCSAIRNGELGENKSASPDHRIYVSF